MSAPLDPPPPPTEGEADTAWDEEFWEERERDAGASSHTNGFAESVPPLDPDTSHGLLARITRVTYARYAAAPPADVIALLSACSLPMPSAIYWTNYDGGKFDTFNGTPCVGGLNDLAASMIEYSHGVVAKGKGRWFMGARSVNGRCRDMDIDCISVITLDCDNRGDWHALRSMLEQAGLGHIAQRSSSHAPPEAIKWHITLALASEWRGEKPTWRAIWRFVVGLFAAIGKLTVDFDFVDEKGVPRPNYGFDHTTDRLGQPIFSSAKRTKDQASPETVYVPGSAIDLDKLLAEGGFDRGWLDEAKVKEEKSQAARSASASRVAVGIGVDPSTSLLALAFSEAGMLGQRIERASISGYAVECPREVHHHTGGRFDTSTMIADPSETGGKGFFLCLHSCGRMDADKVLKLLLPEAVERAKKKWKDAHRKQKQPDTTFRRDEEGATADAVDLRNAERLVEWFGDDIRYVRQWEKWLGWDGKRWRLTDLHVEALAKRTVRQMLRDALEAKEQAKTDLEKATASGLASLIEEAKKRLEQAAAAISHAIISQSAPRVMAMITLARSDPRVAIEHTALNRDPWLLNLQNGTIELRTMDMGLDGLMPKLREHRREDLITQIAPVAYDPAAKCPAWDKFRLEASNNRPEVVAYLRRIAGYCLTGSTKEEALFFFYGPSARNGKGTWTRTIIVVLGHDYAGPAPRRLLFKQKGERHDTEIASLYGKRFVVSAEIDEGEAFDEAKMKDLTGSDPIPARRMREDYWDFIATHKFVLHGQFRPNVRGDDEGTWGRMQALEWEVSFKGREDKQLKDKLQDEAIGILADSLRGCLEWQEIGLAPPDVVVQATRAYRVESDRVGAFITKHLVFDQEAKSATAEVRAKYVAFCEENGDQPVGSKRFWPRVRLAGKGARVEVTDTTLRRQSQPSPLNGYRGQASTVNGYRGIRLIDDLLAAIEALLTKIGDESISAKVREYLEKCPQCANQAYTRLVELVRERAAPRDGPPPGDPWGPS
ncbi:MAG: phage/plasmid primase, P4 family [Polyangiaceae bacterium]